MPRSKDIPDTVAQAKGAAAECLALSAKGEVEVPPMISNIDPDVCVGCQVCIGLCPYSAIEYNDFKNISEVTVLYARAAEVVQVIAQAVLQK